MVGNFRVIACTSSAYWAKAALAKFGNVKHSIWRVKALIIYSPSEMSPIFSLMLSPDHDINAHCHSGLEGSTSFVAVKTLKESAGDKERQDLLKELQVMKSLKPHPNIVTLLGCCTDKGNYFSL